VRAKSGALARRSLEVFSPGAPTFWKAVGANADRARKLVRTRPGNECGWADVDGKVAFASLDGRSTGTDAANAWLFLRRDWVNGLLLKVRTGEPGCSVCCELALSDNERAAWAFFTLSCASAPGNLPNIARMTSSLNPFFCQDTLTSLSRKERSSAVNLRHF